MSSSESEDGVSRKRSGDSVDKEVDGKKRKTGSGLEGKRKSGGRKKGRKGKKKDVGQVGEEEYLVEKILAKKYDEGEGIYKYFIKWIGWPSSTNTWEPLENLNGCEAMLRDFEANWKSEEQGAEEGSASSPLSRDDLVPLDAMPAGKVVKDLVGVVKLKNSITYIVEWEGVGGKMDVSLLDARVFAAAHPDLVIQFYEKRIRWTRDDL